MPSDRFDAALSVHVSQLEERGTAKGAESVIVGMLPPSAGKGERYLLDGEGDRPFLKMNSNNYLGLSLRPGLIAAEEAATHEFGAGPGAVRFISGTYRHHVELERRLAAFHNREEGMIFSAAYATILGVLVPLITKETTVISDELNHNCIINAMRLARPLEKKIYRHLDMESLEQALAEGSGQRAIVVTDGIFSMRGSHAPLERIVKLVREYDGRYPENAVLVVDDSHGVAAFGETGRGTEEHTGARADILVGTLGKGLGVNGGYVVGSTALARFLRESAPTYIYSNPITVGECAAAIASLDVVESADGAALLEHLRAMQRRFERGLVDLGWETIPGPHPVTPLMVRDTP
ncbi:MAG: pyridoxal phosphate-dependent aminotransferase family protein, partial [Holophagales bacterium]|nr:pyridoxal phosphate-dependent aminotransferase family protein [Holophagales bacterium]